MDYNYLKGKKYTISDCDNSAKRIMSFSKEHHVKISSTAKLIFDCFDGENSLDDIINILALNEIDISKEELIDIIDKVFLPNNMFEGQAYQRKNDSLLWFKINLIESDKLASFFSRLTFLYKKTFALPIIFLIITSIVLSGWQMFDRGLSTSYTNSLKVLLIVYIDMIIHEFGHIVAAYFFNIPVGKIGMGIYLFYPVMFVDMSNTWRASNKQRVLVDVGGIYFQMMLLIPLTALGFITKDTTFFVTNISIAVAVVINLLPILKLDGYWLFCDGLGLDNLSQHAFEKILGKGKNASRKYVFFSWLYVITIFVSVAMALIYSISIFKNIDYVALQLKKIIYMLTNNDIYNGLDAFNNIFIYILPLLFLSFMAISILFNVIAGFIKGIFNFCDLKFKGEVND